MGALINDMFVRWCCHGMQKQQTQDARILPEADHGNFSTFSAVYNNAEIIKYSTLLL
jgi:hypothetical protein